jgi:hypothetical protein
MTRLARIPFLALAALFAVGLGSVLPFSPVALAVQASTPTEEEKNPGEPTVEIKLAEASLGPQPGPTVRPTPPTPVRPANRFPLTSLSRSPLPTVALNNGLSAHYRC